MAAKKPKAPKKFKQARKAAVADAKGAFSGKTKAVRRDPMAKVSAEDKAVLSEVKKEAKAGYITDDKGNKVFSKPTETAQERIARDRREAKAAVDRMYEKEDAAAKKTAPAKAAAPAATKPATKKPTVAKTKKTKPAVKKPSATKSMTRAEKSAANKAAWAKMTPAERKNWAATRGTAAATATKPTTTKPTATTPKVKTGVAAQGELKTAAEVDKYKAAVAQGKSKGEAVRIAKGGSANLPAVVAKKGAGTVATTGAKSAGKKLTAGAVLKGVGKGAWKATGGRIGLALTAAGLAAGPIQRKLSEGNEGRTTYELMTSGKLRPAPKTTADYGRTVPGGAKGKAAAAAAGVAAGAAAMKQRSNQPRITGQGKYKGRNVPTINSGGSTTVYKVETGDTLSGIAKRAGVTLSELMEVNKKIKDPRKIYRNTTVRIPSKGKMPTPMYTGPVPYVPGSKAAKEYEASRKK
jgi:LysM repeat protein